MLSVHINCVNMGLDYMQNDVNYFIESIGSMKPRSLFHYVLFSIFFALLALDILYFPATSDIRYIVLGTVWFFVARTANLKSIHTVLVVLGLMGLLLFFYLFDRTSQATERIATLIYLLLLFSFVQQTVEVAKHSS